MISNLVILLAREDAEVHLHALTTMTEQFQPCEWGQSWKTVLFGNNFWIMGCT
jgi:hypothetical protein